MPKKPSDFLKLITIFVVYLVTARFGLKLDPVGGFATLVWLPTGISLAAILIFGFKIWPSIALGAFLANLLTGAPPLVAFGIGIGNTLEAIIGAYLLKKIEFRSSLDRLKDVVMLIVLAASLSTLISATLGVVSLWFGGIITFSKIFDVWLAWWVGDMVSDLVVAPFILVWSIKPNFYSQIPFKRLMEGMGLALSVVVVSIVIYRGFFNLGNQGSSPRAYIVFPLLIWAALRFGTRGVVTSTFILSIISVWITSLGYGPFTSQTLHQSLLSVQVYIGVISVSALILAAIASERKELEERKNEFISIASHELKTPITSIKGYIQILRQFLKESQNEKLLSYAGKMDQQIDRLTKLVNDLLDVSKIQSGKLELQLEETDLNELIEDTITDLQLVNKHKIIFEKGEKQLLTLIDKYQISEVLINLISNAIKYSPKSDKVIVRATSKKDSVVTSIEDFGIGISKKDQEKVFRKFFRVDNRIRQSFSGLGLGLYISSEIVKHHQGDIWISSVKGRGTTVSFKLPMIKQ